MEAVGAGPAKRGEGAGFFALLPGSGKKKASERLTWALYMAACGKVPQAAVNRCGGKRQAESAEHYRPSA